MSILHHLFSFRRRTARVPRTELIETTHRSPVDPVSLSGSKLGLIAGNGTLPLRFCEAARRNQTSVAVVAHEGETDKQIDQLADTVEWIKVGQLGRLISFFQEQQVRYVAMVGGINRVQLFGGVKLDLRGASLMMRLRSTKDDKIMRGIADELGSEGIEVIDSTIFMGDMFAPIGVLTRSDPTEEEWSDIRIGADSLAAMSSQDIGQLVVVREGVIVAVEAVEGSDSAIRRGGELGGKGTVVVKFPKATQDMRFDVPTIGVRTVESLISAGARVLAIQSGSTIIVDRDKVVELADRHQISIVGCQGARALSETHPTSELPDGN